MSWKRIMQSLAGKFGYEITKVRTGEKLPYTWCYPYNSRIYSPWFEDWFQRIFDKVKDQTKVSEDRCYMIYRFTQHCSHLNGEFAECGVYKGGTAYLIADTLMKCSENKKELHLFDTFSGMPKTANEDDSHHIEGDFKDTTLNDVKEYLQKFYCAIFHYGIIPETFEGLGNKKFSFVHIDVDIYQSVKDCCDFFYDRLIKGGIIIFDDYGFRGYEKAAKKAVDEFFSDKQEKPVAFRTGQCFVIKL